MGSHESIITGKVSVEEATTLRRRFLAGILAVLAVFGGIAGTSCYDDGGQSQQDGGGGGNY
jgi:hypothetical protein